MHAIVTLGPLDHVTTTPVDVFFSHVLQAYVGTHVTTAIYVVDFLKQCKSRGRERERVEELVQAYERLRLQASGGGVLLGCLDNLTSQPYYGEAASS